MNRWGPGQRGGHVRDFTESQLGAVSLAGGLSSLVLLGLLAGSSLGLASARTAFSGLACAATAGSFFTGRSRSFLVAATCSSRLAVGACTAFLLSAFLLGSLLVLLLRRLVVVRSAHDASGTTRGGGRLRRTGCGRFGLCFALLWALGLRRCRNGKEGKRAEDQNFFHLWMDCFARFLIAA